MASVNLLEFASELLKLESGTVDGLQILILFTIIDNPLLTGTGRNSDVAGGAEVGLTRLE